MITETQMKYILGTKMAKCLTKMEIWAAVRFSKATFARKTSHNGWHNTMQVSPREIKPLLNIFKNI